MARHLRMTVYATDDNDVVHCFTPDDAVPEWVVAQIGNDDAWADDAEGAEGDTSVESGEPPRTGKGSGVAAWLVYAESIEVEVPEGASRDEIIELVDAK